MNLQTFSDEQSWLAASVKFFEDAVNKNPGPIALSGGSTPLPVYEAIAARANIQAHGIEVYQADERYVPSADPRSNQKLIREHFMLPLQICCFTPFRTDVPIEESVKKYELAIQSGIAPYGGFALTILGIGPDGHTASLFPHSPALHETKRLTAHTQTDQFAVKDRLTLTFPAILGSKNILVLLRGKDKQPVIDELRHGTKTTDEFPAKKLLEREELTICYCQEIKK